MKVQLNQIALKQIQPYLKCAAQFSDYFICHVLNGLFLNYYLN